MPDKPTWRVLDWLDAFLADHEAAYSESGWPMAGSHAAADLRRSWLRALIDAKVLEAEAREASGGLCEERLWCEEHPAKVVELILAARAEARQERAIGAPPPGDDRERAALDSRGCPRCGGGGLVTVYHPRYDGRHVVVVEAADARGELRRVQQPGTAAAHCACPVGRWMRARVGMDVARRMPDLCDVLDGKSRWLADDPTLGDVAMPEGATTHRELWRAIVEAMRRGEGGVVQARDERLT